ncbi:hypothetical protein D8S78_07910 [Natrialba swarupiae]|nr:hypothetical protein [Natrialba swarupiae]
MLLDGPTFDDDPRAIAMSDELSAEENSVRSRLWRVARTSGNGRGPVRTRREVVANVLVARVAPRKSNRVSIASSRCSRTTMRPSAARESR